MLIGDPWAFSKSAFLALVILKRLCIVGVWWGIVDGFRLVRRIRIDERVLLV
jgi:hypothetical protein